MTKKLKTPNDGATALRKNIVAHIRRQTKAYRKLLGQALKLRVWSKAIGLEGRVLVLDDLLKFVQSTDERASAKPGGLGRK